MQETSQEAERGNSPTPPGFNAPSRPRRKSSPARIMARLLGERKGLFAGNLFLRLIKDLLPFASPILIGVTVDLLSGASGRDRTMLGIELTQNDVRSIVIVAVIMAVLAVVKTVVGYIHTMVAAHMGRHVVQAARRDLAEAAMQMSLDERRRYNSGDLLDRCLADSKGLRSFTQDVIIRIISNTVRAVFPVGFMFAIDPLLAVVVLAVIPLQSTVSALLQRRLQRQTHEARARESLHTSAVKEAIDGWNNVASVGGQDWAAQGINDTAAASEDAKIIKKHTTAAISAVISLCTAFGIAAVYAIGGWRIISSGVFDGNAATTTNALTLGTLTAFIGVAKKTYAPFQAYTKIVSSYRTGLVNLERIADVLDAPMIDPRHHGPKLKVTAGVINLDNVSFTYSEGEAPTLRELTGEIPGRSLTVITGSSGAGKTTLLRLLLGLDVPGAGTISIDGQDINVARFASVQDAIALVPQEPVLFTGTMSENLLLGLENVTTKELLEACDRAGLLDMVRQLPNGLETAVGSGKHMLSGGQLRRMAIARALLRKPGVLLLDEPTTGLDIQNSSLVLNTLRRISDHTTVVMVSHRSEPLKASDHHLILHDGGWTNSQDLPDEVAIAEPDITPELSIENGATGPTINGHVAHVSTITTRNGVGDQTQTDGLLRHYEIDQHKISLSAMGRPIVMSGIDSAAATARVLMVSGHRTGVRPVTAIAPALFAQVVADERSVVALASIENVNPDGDFSADRTTVLGIEIETDHQLCRSVETRALQSALHRWRTDVVIDIAAKANPQMPSQAVGHSHHVEVAIRFLPNEQSNPSASIVAFAHDIRARLDRSSFSFKVSMLGCRPGSITHANAMPVVELTATDSTDPATVQALIEATVASYRAASSAAELITA